MHADVYSLNRPLSLSPKHPNKDLNSRIRCHCVHQIITFIQFHVHLYSDGGHEFVSVRDFNQKARLVHLLQRVRDDSYRLLHVANKRVLDLEELLSLNALEKEIEDIIYDFQLNNCHFKKMMQSNEHFCMSLPSLYAAKSMDDTLVMPSEKKYRGNGLNQSPTRPKSDTKFIRGYSDQDVLRLSRRRSVSDF
jgi:hypothetical protein